MIEKALIGLEGLQRVHVDGHPEPVSFPHRCFTTHAMLLLRASPIADIAKSLEWEDEVVLANLECATLAL